MSLVYDIHVDIAAPPDRVWAVMSDIERWPEWTPSVRRVRQLDPGPLAPGVRARISQPKFPPALWRVAQVEPQRRFVWISRGPGLHVTADHAIEPRPGGSRVRLSVAYDGWLGRLLGRATASINRDYLALEAAGLKRRVEST